MSRDVLVLNVRPDYRSEGATVTEIIWVTCPVILLSVPRHQHDNEEARNVQMPAKKDSEAIVRDIKRQTRKKYNAEEKISILL